MLGASQVEWLVIDALRGVLQMCRVLGVLKFVHFISFHVRLELHVVYGLFSLWRIVKIVKRQFQTWLRNFQINSRHFISLLVLIDIICLFQCVLRPVVILWLELFHLFLHLFKKTQIFASFSFDRFRFHLIVSQVIK